MSVMLVGSLNVQATPFALTEIDGAYGSWRFNGYVCTWQPCRRLDMYAAHELRVELKNEKVTIRFVEPATGKEFRRLEVPASSLTYYDQELGGYSEGLETFLLEEPTSRTSREEAGLVTTEEVIPAIELRFVKYKNKPTDTEYRIGYEHIEGTLVRKTLSSPAGVVLSREESMASHEISTQYIRGRAPLGPNW